MDKALRYVTLGEIVFLLCQIDSLCLVRSNSIKGIDAENSFGNLVYLELMFSFTRIADDVHESCPQNNVVYQFYLHLLHHLRSRKPHHKSHHYHHKCHIHQILIYNFPHNQIFLSGSYHNHLDNNRNNYHHYQLQIHYSYMHFH